MWFMQSIHLVRENVEKVMKWNQWPFKSTDISLTPNRRGCPRDDTAQEGIV